MDKAATESLDTDILVLGAGPVGMTLALALADSGQRIHLLDRRPRGAWADDPRGLALSHGCRQLLERLDAWNAAAGTLIKEIHVSQRGGFGRTMINASDYGTPALGYVMRYHVLAAALDARVPATQWLEPGQVATIATNDDGALVTITRGDVTQQITAKLVVHAEGTPQNDPDVSVSDYGQHAVIAEVRPATPHGNRAWERFTPDGPLALLPIGEDYSVVFTVPPAKAARLLALGDDEFLAALRTQFGTRLDFVRTGPRAAYPLALRVRRHLTQPRQVWIGNAAQALHPVSGQGFNLGLRDAWELAEKLLDGLEQQPDAGHPTALAAYARGRQTDRRGSMAFTDGIVRLFSNDIPPLRLARGLGLLALDLAPPLRHFVAKRMIWGGPAL
ncbi:MAG: FAD-dependent monooxygenase [Propionivibrio sp.]|nr:FAD-dependent monooxygenase [Propionivibrio sp.]